MSSKQDLSSTFTKETGDIHLGGIDALVRLTLDQVRTDARRGLKTGMFVSGYRGSPVGMLDAALIKQQKLLLEHHIKFVDGLNEDLAATAVWGTQMMHTVGKQKFDGVTGMWYGKAPGVDRSGDALKHANYTGIGKNGGVLAIAGEPRRLIFQGVHKIAGFDYGREWGDEAPRSDIVLIGRSLPEAALRAGFAECVAG